MKYLQQCAEDYNSAIQLGMFDEYIFYVRAGVHKDLSRYEEAISDYELSLVLNPNQDDVYSHMGKPTFVKKIQKIFMIREVDYDNKRKEQI